MLFNITVIDNDIKIENNLYQYIEPRRDEIITDEYINSNMNKIKILPKKRLEETIKENICEEKILL